jgi:hypothetical protein
MTSLSFASLSCLALASVPLTLALVGCAADTDTRDEPPVAAAELAVGTAPKPLVHYEWGNQVGGSRLDIFADGTIAHSERACCHTFEYVPVAHPNLGATELSALVQWVARASQGVQSIGEGRPSSMGSSAGTLEVFGSSSKPVIVRRVERSAVMMGNDRVTANAAAEADAILDLVLAYTDGDMYR